jgi:hypothetical protein
MTKRHARQFSGPWSRAYAQMQLYLLEMLAARPNPSAVRIRLAKPLVTPEDIRRDFPPLRDALLGRFGSGRVHFEVVDAADSHEILLECTPPSLVQNGCDPPSGAGSSPAQEQRDGKHGQGRHEGVEKAA